MPVGGDATHVHPAKIQPFSPLNLFMAVPLAFPTPRRGCKTRCKIYMSEYLKPYKWTYLNEVVQSNIAGNQRVGNFKITNGISKPRHVFVFKINTANIESQTANPFLYNTFSVSTNSRTLDRCYLDVGNENEYPDIHYKPSSDP